MSRSQAQREDWRSRRRTSGARLRSGYGYLSTRPLHILAFLSPLILLYEVGSVVYLSGPSGSLVETIRAWKILSGFFEAFGVAGFYMLPGIALATVLLVWHFLERDRWAVRPVVLAGMFMESVGWMLPLLVLTVLVQQVMAGHGAPPPAAGGPAPQSLMDMPWQARLTISIGAGIYEELLFRMILVAVVHFLAVDLLRVGEAVGRGAAILVSAAAFALYHDVGLHGGGVDIGALMYYLVAGMYFAVLYLLRGFGIVVGVHAVFDVFVLILARPPVQ